MFYGVLRTPAAIPRVLWWIDVRQSGAICLYIYQVQVFRSRDFARLQSAFPGLSQYSLAEPRLLGEDLENYLRALFLLLQSQSDFGHVTLISNVRFSPSLKLVLQEILLFEIFSLMRVECTECK